MGTEIQPRHFRRYAVQLPLLHLPESSRKDGARVGWTCDLSRGGARVELDQPIPVRTQLRVRLQTDRGVIEAIAQVVWAGEPLSPRDGIPHGLAFAQMADDELESIQHAVISWGLTRRGARLPSEVLATCQPKGQAGTTIRGRTRDISRTGFLLRIPQLVPQGTVLETTLHFQRRRLTVDAEVIWVAPPEGRTPGGLIRHGLRFTKLDWSTALALAVELVEEPQGNSWYSSRGGRA